jgi:DTW domain-containing protein YfiP
VSRRRKPHLRCADCRLHRSLCICALLPRLETQTRLLLIVHQLEATKPTNTGLLAARCLPNSAVVFRGRAPDGSEGDPVDQAVRQAAQPLMLFPHPSATPLDAWRGGPATLIVPDGTWAQASSTRRRTDLLRGIPCVSLPAAGADAARLRRPARPGRLATLEAVAIALGILEGPAVGEALMRVYRIMADRTLWTNGRLPTEAVTGGIPAGVQSHDPLRTS